MIKSINGRLMKQLLEAKDPRLKWWRDPERYTRYVVRSWVEMKEDGRQSVLVWIPEVGKMQRVLATELGIVDHQRVLRNLLEDEARGEKDENRSGGASGSQTTQEGWGTSFDRSASGSGWWIDSLISFN